MQQDPRQEEVEISGQASECRNSGRAERFPVHTSLRYRLNGDIDWREGRTENISRTGVLFKADEMLAIDTAIEMQFELAAEVEEGGGAMVICSGQIVRTLLPPATDAAPAMAAVISEYRLVRGSTEFDA